MTKQPAKPSRWTLGLTKDLVAVVISIISFIISTVSVYTTSLKAPDISIVVAPYIQHGVDDFSLNEAFFVPLTLINRGARPGTVLSLELKISYLPDGNSQTYYGQYFSQEDTQTSLGGFFTPITLNGYSSTSRTVAFYPVGQRAGNFFARQGRYEFQVIAAAANVRDDSPWTVTTSFRINLDEAIFGVMQEQSDGEYVFPLRIEAVP